MVIEERMIDLNVISATDLKKVKMFGKQATYVVASVYPNEKQVTEVDWTGGVNPSWNSVISISVEEEMIMRPGVSITFDIYSPRLFGTKTVGTVQLPLRDVGRACNAIGEVVFMSVRVQTPSGRPQGIINIAAKLGGRRVVTSPEPRSESGDVRCNPGPGYSTLDTVVKYPIHGYSLRQQHPTHHRGFPLRSSAKVSQSLSRALDIHMGYPVATTLKDGIRGAKF